MVPQPTPKMTVHWGDSVVTSFDTLCWIVLYCGGIPKGGSEVVRYTHSAPDMCPPRLFLH